jgi:hypothetical protein
MVATYGTASRLTPQPTQWCSSMTITNEQYHADPAVSASHLHASARKSPYHYWSRYLDLKRKRTRANCCYAAWLTGALRRTRA